MIIALAGNMGVGKDTIASELQRQMPSLKRTAFAKSLKDIAGFLFDFDEDVLWGPSQLRNEPDARAAFDTYWGHVFERLDPALSPNISDLVDPLFPVELRGRAWQLLRYIVLNDFAQQGAAFTPRYALQRLGTEWGRKIWDDVWLHAVKSRIDQSDHSNWIITDCRFPNEAAFLRSSLNAALVWVEAPVRRPAPTGPQHASEPQKQDFETYITQVFNNDGAMAYLPARVSSLLSQLIPSIPAASSV
jgi:hypothetical protein